MAPALLLFSLWSLPLLINPTISLSFDDVYLFPKILWVYAVVLPSALLVVWRYRAALRGAWRSLVLLTVWIAWLVLSTVANGVGWSGWWGAPDRADGVLMHLGYGTLLLAGLVWARSEAYFKDLFERAVLAGGALLAITNVLQQVGLLGVPGDGALSGVGATLYGGTMGNRGYLGGALALLLPPALVALARRPHRGWMWVAVALITWGWVGSFTRGAWLAGALGLLGVLVWARPRPSVWAWGAVLLGLLLCGATTSLREGGRTFSPTGQGAQAITDSSGRGVLWRSAVFGIRERPVLGWGTPALSRAMHERPARELLAEYGTPDPAHLRQLSLTPAEAPRFLVTHWGGRREVVSIPYSKVHNEYLDYALTYGTPAALLFTVLLVVAVGSGRVLVPGVSAGLLAYAAYLFTWPEIIRFAPVAWFMMGLALAGHVSKPEDGIGVTSPSAALPRTRTRKRIS